MIPDLLILCDALSSVLQQAFRFFFHITVVQSRNIFLSAYVIESIFCIISPNLQQQVCIGKNKKDTFQNAFAQNQKERNFKNFLSIYLTLHCWKIKDISLIVVLAHLVKATCYSCSHIRLEMYVLSSSLILSFQTGGRTCSTIMDMVRSPKNQQK